MTDLPSQVRRVAELAEQATKRPWKPETGAFMTPEDYDLWFARGPLVQAKTMPEGKAAVAADADFTAAAHNLPWPTLAAAMEERDRLREENERLRTFARRLYEIVEAFMSDEGNAIEWKDTDSMFYVDGSKESFRCDCKCNVFRSSLCETKAKCNACGAVYTTAREALTKGATTNETNTP